MKLSVAIVAKRDGRACAHCGAEEALSVQHRANKGMGGSKERERRSNGLVLCAVFNSALEQHRSLAERAKRMGWKCSKWDDTTKVPYWHAPSQTWWLADDEGGRRAATQDEVRAHLSRVAEAA